jgi:hypothetical protein
VVEWEDEGVQARVTLHIRNLGYVLANILVLSIPLAAATAISFLIFTVVLPQPRRRLFLWILNLLD